MLQATTIQRMTLEQGKDPLNQPSNRLWESFSAVDMHSVKQNV